MRFVLVSFAAPVVGNFTDEEFSSNISPQDTSEYPLQRDEVGRAVSSQGGGGSSSSSKTTGGERTYQTPLGK